jgi:hypothetical protein
MSNIRVELNHDGVREFLHSPELIALLRGYADSAAAQLGEGYKADTYNAGTRSIASVYADTDEARKKNLENNAILKAVLANGD